MEFLALMVATWSVCLSVLVTTVGCAKTAEPIEIVFVVLIYMGQRDHVLDCGTYRCHLAYTIK